MKFNYVSLAVGIVFGIIVIIYFNMSNLESLLVGGSYGITSQVRW